MSVGPIFDGKNALDDVELNNAVAVVMIVAVGTTN